MDVVFGMYETLSISKNFYVSDDDTSELMRKSWDTYGRIRHDIETLADIDVNKYKNSLGWFINEIAEEEDDT